MISAINVTVEYDQWDELCISSAAAAALRLNMARAKNRDSFF